MIRELSCDLIAAIDAEALRDVRDTREIAANAQRLIVYAERLAFSADDHADEDAVARRAIAGIAIQQRLLRAERAAILRDRMSASPRAAKTANCAAVLHIRR